ncbi:MAG: hypothetical protein GY851_06585 [bacterium]|nr:hypothetical protein [bacterium]
MPAKYKAYVVPHTHWDRAWYVPFEEFRIRLVRLIDRVCDTLEKDPSYTSFSLDGQTVVLEDYLAIRPQMEARLKRLVKEGRLFVGPWYILPDELLVSGESLVRNLMLGHRMSADFGHTMDVGHGPDTFGHVAQLPQLLRGFDLDNLVFGRGLDLEAHPVRTEFTLEGIDGSKVLALHMRHWYNNAAFLGYRIRWGDTEGYVQDKALAMQQIQGACERLMGETGSRVLLLCNGVDHSEHQPELPKLLKVAQSKTKDVQFEIGSFEDYVKAVKKDLRGKRLQKVSGELRYPYADLLRGVNSTRMYLKIANQECQDLLEKRAEPLSALAWLTKGLPYAGDHLWHAWRELLKNHPHDDICGCSADGVHRDMEHRFGVVKQVGEVVERDAVRAIGHAVDHTGRDGVPIMVFNPLGARRKGAHRIAIDLHAADGIGKDFVIVDESGRKVPYHRVSASDEKWTEVLKAYEVRRHMVEVELDLPPLGYRTLYVQTGKGAKPAPNITVKPRGFENDLYRLAINDDGSLRVTDKKTKRAYNNLLVFEDTEDAGDGYNWSPLRKRPAAITTAKKRARVRLVEKTALSATWRITHRMRVPKGLTEDRAARSRDTEILVIESDVTCRVGTARVDIVTRVTNTACDHRVRALLPTGIDTDRVMVDGHFAVVEQSTDAPAPRKHRYPYPTQHQGRFADISDGKAGFAMVNLGMPEFEVVRRRGRCTLAQTLYRSTGLLTAGDALTRPGHTGPVVDTPEAQCLRSMTFQHGFMVHKGDWRRARVLDEAQRHNVDVVTTRCDILGGTDPTEIEIMKHDPFVSAQPTRPVPREGTLPKKVSLIDIGSRELVLSAVKKCETRNSIIVRVYNPAGDTVKATLRAFRPIKKAFATNLNEKPGKAMKVSGDSMAYSCGPFKILTFELVL